MSETLTKVIVDCSTGVVAEVPLTSEELMQREADATAFGAVETERLAAEETARVAKEAAHNKLAALGLTADEIAALSK